MTKEQLEQRIAELTQQKQKAEIAVIALTGSINECNMWLNKLKEETNVTSN